MNLVKEIKFRGKTKTNDLYGWVKKGEWVTGNLIIDDGKYYIGTGYPNKQGTDNYIEVTPETVGQYTGLRDENNKEIYEGDVIEFYGYAESGFYHGRFSDKGKVWYSPEDFMFLFEHPNISLYNAVTKYRGLNAKIRILGNIYENPELLEKGE